MSFAKRWEDERAELLAHLIDEGVIRLYTFLVYVEIADSDAPKRLVGEVRAHSASEALRKASEFLEIPEHDLVVYLKEKNA